MAAERAGCRTFGIEYDPELAARAKANGLTVCQASSEHLPFADASLDGVICKVVILLTDEAQSIAEIARCVICLRVGQWPSREEDVEEVDVDKLKEMVHVKDADIAKLDRYLVRGDGGAK